MAPTKVIEPSAELIQMQVRNRRRLEREAMDTPYDSGALKGHTPRVLWREIGAGIASPDKMRVRVSHVLRDPAARARAEALRDGALAEKARTSQQSSWFTKEDERAAFPTVWNGRAMPAPGRPSPLRPAPSKELPESVPRMYHPGFKRVITLGSGVHVEGTAHYGVNNGMRREVTVPVEVDVSRPHETEARIEIWNEPRTGRGKSELHQAKHEAPKRGGLELAAFDLRVQALEKNALELAGKPGGAKAHKAALRARRAYELELARHRASNGTMARLEDFSNSAARSTRGRAQAEKIKQDGGRTDYN